MENQISRCTFRCLFLCAVFFAVVGSYAQKAEFQWARLLSGFSNEDQLRNATMDADGNVIASYYREDAIEPGSWRSNLVMKIDTRMGEVKWSQRQLPAARGLATWSNGSIYVAGSLAYFNSSMGASLGGTQTYFSSRGIPTEGTGGAYLARLSSTNGAVEMIRHFGTSLYVMPYYLAVAPDGDFMVFGIYMRAAAQFGDFTLPAPSGSTIKNRFLVKMGPAGEVRWAKAFQSSKTWLPMHGMEVDAAGSVIVGADLGAFTLDGVSYPGDENFVAKFNSSGSLTWLKRNFSDSFRSDKNGNFIVRVYSEGNWMLQKYNPNAEIQWSVPAAFFNCSGVDASGNFIVADNFRIGGDFAGVQPGELTIGGISLQTEAESELWAGKFSATGELNWAIQTHGQDLAYRPMDFSGDGYIASWTTPKFVFSHPERGVLVGGIAMGRTLFGETLLEGMYKKDFQPETSFFIARIAEPPSQNPELKIGRDGSRCKIAWASTVTDFLLESADTIPTSSWTRVDATPSVSAGEASITLDAGGTQKYFRLRKQ